VTGLEASRIDVTGLDGEPVTFSLDGEIRTDDRLRFDVRQRPLRIRVGDDYVPEPEREDT
jgi:diacylglycerol kinase family enzyme